ncbi:odorant receptor 94b-like [Bradysia coprophila]|uniref:odorant receptor 94b-like n=1 Tax=Bradysia coprophila TaxID=38358 RepID=UPI00187DD8C8|nr:odorant receptor 94b-like [Bradysia coprophila]XP_037024536.1 odorant receptor 94b-like [Bradysia coprophila]
MVVSSRIHKIQVHKVMNLLISFFYRIGVWHFGDKPTIRESVIKWFYFVYYFVFFVSLLCGMISSSNKIHQSTFTASVTVIVGVLLVKLQILLWEQEMVLGLLNRISVYSIRNDETFLICSNKLEVFIKFAVVFYGATFVTATFASFVVPFLGKEKSIIYSFAFPLDWKSDNFAYFLANAFITSHTYLTIVVILFSIIIWYLIMQCSLRYEGLAGDVRIMGRITEQKNGKMSHNAFMQDLKELIIAHAYLRGLIDEFESLSSNIFFLQFCTSGACICATTYCLAFDNSENMIERMITIYMFGYNIAELFMITYFGNEMMLSSSRRYYSLFESNWFDQPQTTSKCMIIFGEYLKQPHALLIGKLFPLTLETFNRILRSAYSMFNILKSTQQ